MSTMPTRVDGSLFAAAKSTGAINSRSAAQQINHWARIGREFEASTKVSQRDIEAVLAVGASYDALREREQAIVRATWDERVTESLTGLDFAAEFTAAGVAWSETDLDGEVIGRGSPSTQPPYGA